MNELGIEQLSLFGMPPVEQVRLAADVGCRCIGIGLTRLNYCNPHSYPDWSLRSDPMLRREMVAAMRDAGVRISIVEGFAIQPGKDVRDLAPDLDIVGELGGERINLVSIDPDQARTFDGFAAMAEMAGERGIETTAEVGTMLGFAAALAALRHVDRPNFRLLIDTMHYFRLGGSIAEFAALDPERVGYVQLCDVPLVSTFESYREEALHERLAPGAGELPLAAFVRLIRPEVVVSLEIPQRSLAEAGRGPLERVGACVEAARALLAAVDRAPATA